jgi:hypothetical protein
MKAGIVADNYKVPMFEKELTAEGFAFSKMPFTKAGKNVDGSTVIQVECDQSQVAQLKALCERVQGMARKMKVSEN